MYSALRATPSRHQPTPEMRSVPREGLRLLIQQPAENDRNDRVGGQLGRKGRTDGAHQQELVKKFDENAVGAVPGRLGIDHSPPMLGIGSCVA